MIRTRDFLLFVLAAGFLLIAITTTVATAPASEPAPAPFADAPAVEYEAEVPGDELDRAERLAALREKIRAQEGQSIRAVYEETVAATGEPPESTAPTSSADVPASTIERCADYRKVTLAWPASEVQTAEREGARIVYTQTANEAPAISGSSTAETAPEENILLQLPMRTQPLSGTTCLSTDVVGVALDGSLIRNEDHQLYGIFGPETLIGYALDGFPIYGSASAEIELDTCGGAVVGSGYRYYLHPDRPGVLGCFAGTPVDL